MAIRINGDNTTAAPGITRGDDTDTGIQLGTGEISLVTGGTEKVKVDNGALKVTGQSTGITDGGVTFDWESVSQSARIFAESSAASQFKFYTTNSAGVRSEQMRIDDTGAIKAPNHPEGYFYGLTSCSGGDGSDHGVILSDYAYNKGGFSISSNKVIIPKSGWYRIVMGVESVISNGGYGIRAMRMRPRVNGTGITWHTDRWHCATTGSTTNNIHYSFNDIYYLNLTANDQVDGIFRAYWGGTRTENVKCNAQFYYLG